MRIVFILTIIGVIASMQLQADELRIMPPDVAARWQCSLSAGSGWKDASYDSAGWQTVARVPGRYPDWMEAPWQALANFMWHPAGANLNKPVYFRRVLALPGQVEQAMARVTADDEFDLYVNGQSVGKGREAHKEFTFDLAAHLQTGRNVLALRARDVQPAGYGLLVVPQIIQQWPVNDGGWQVSLNGRSGWRKAVPDAAPPLTLEACISVPGGMEDFSTAYFRRDLELDGLPLAAYITILGDDSYELYVNGRLVTMEKRIDKAYQPKQVDLADLLHAGRNRLTVRVTNDWGPGRLYCVPTVLTTF